MLKVLLLSLCVVVGFDCRPHTLDVRIQDNRRGPETCSSGKDLCRNGSKCVPYEAECDGVIDCPDGDDEWFCNVTTVCAYDEFLCFTGECLPYGSQCNKTVECQHGEDEWYCYYGSGLGDRKLNSIYEIISFVREDPTNQNTKRGIFLRTYRRTLQRRSHMRLRIKENIQDRFADMAEST